MYTKWRKPCCWIYYVLLLLLQLLLLLLLRVYRIRFVLLETMHPRSLDLGYRPELTCMHACMHGRAIRCAMRCRCDADALCCNAYPHFGGKDEPRILLYALLWLTLVRLPPSASICLRLRRILRTLQSGKGKGNQFTEPTPSQVAVPAGWNGAVVRSDLPS